MTHELLNLVKHADNALLSIEPTIRHLLSRFSRTSAHVVILDPTKPYDPEAELPILLQRTFVRPPNEESALYQDLARNKANISWRERMSTRDIGENAPYLYRQGDTKFPGGVFFNGAVAGVSGLPWEYDDACGLSTIAFFWASVRREREDLMTSNNINLIE